MNFFEAMKAVEEGEKIREKRWHKDCYLVLKITKAKLGKKEIDEGQIVSESGMRYNLNLSNSSSQSVNNSEWVCISSSPSDPINILKDEWELFEESKNDN